MSGDIRPVSPEEQARYLAEQAKEVESSENAWFTGEELGRPPNRNELWLHYIRSGRAAEFARLHGRQRQPA